MAVKNKVKVLVIIPAFNEENNLPRVIESIRKSPADVDMIVVNDCSSDQTSEVAKREGVILINLSANLGIGGAVQTGYKYAYLNNYDIAIQVDADGQHDPSQIPQLIQPVIDEGMDMVIGSRFLDESGKYNPPIMRLMGMRLFSRITSFIIKQRITDTTSGFRAIGKDLIAFFAQNYPIDFPDSESIIMVHKVGFKIKEIPINMNVRQEGKSSINVTKSLYYPFKVGISILSVLIRSIKLSKE